MPSDGTRTAGAVADGCAVIHCICWGAPDLEPITDPTDSVGNLVFLPMPRKQAPQGDLYWITLYQASPGAPLVLGDAQKLDASDLQRRIVAQALTAALGTTLGVLP